MKLKVLYKKYSLFLLLLFSFSSILHAKPVELVLWHSLAGNGGEALLWMVNAFNKSQSEFAIKPVYKGEYNDSLTSFAAAFRAGKAPALIQVFEVGKGIMLQPKQVIKPVEVIMREQGLTLPLDSLFPAVRAFYSKEGLLQAMPFNISIPVIFYNANVLKKQGISNDNFPKTWQALEALLIKLKKAGFACGYTSAYPSWIHIEAFSALHGLPLVKNNKAVYDNDAILRHIARLARWQHLHYFEYGGRRNEATALFTSGRCPIFSQSLGAYNSLASLANFEVKAALLPLDETLGNKRHNIIPGGAALWAINDLSPEEYKGIALFFAFIAKASTQAYWYQHTGYLPLGLQGEYKPFLEEKNPAVILAKQELNRPNEGLISYAGPQNQIRTANDEALESVFAGLKSPEEAIHDAVKRADYLMLRFSRVK